MYNGSQRNVVSVDMVFVRIDGDGEPEDKMIYQNDLYVVKRVRDSEIGEAIVMRLHLPKDGVREFTIPLTAVTSKEELRKQLSMQGIAVIRTDELMKYTTTWVNELQSQSEADEARRQFGWVDDELTGFVLGKEEVRADKIKSNPPSTATTGMFSYFEPRGTLEGWKKTSNFALKKNRRRYARVYVAYFDNGNPDEYTWFVRMMEIEDNEEVDRIWDTIENSSE